MAERSSTSAVPMPQTPQAKPPPNLLTIPREIRQKILHYSFCDSIDADIRFYFNICLVFRISDKCENDDLYNFASDTINSGPSPYTHDWAHTLDRIHPTISEELGFVVEKVLDELEFEAFNHPVGGWRRQMVGEDAITKRGRWQWSCMVPWRVRQCLMMHIVGGMMLMNLFESDWDTEMS
ncbi:hypothetical protein BLS_006449 [Venturia inaequalis]|uniref:Uncharacterized protein n=1 Tax=Venturia inaequalis TaxID=5025 RepID=A0A8H3URN2_VENIN|nr:hypothetical protein BLS_006449 [Venturia inaequalis]KAE9974413.1 hypothetical protein EG327_008784 [Venturia inaequalis]KAE9978509.1 hypothetical protein EG328_001419 [Venturia inaequalis]RDI89374.1 hypothetical protein Vi05172_g329 [Venturia inaequalis]